MVTQLHEHQLDRIRHESDISQPFPIMNGVSQGCVFASTLLSVLFSMIHKQATADLDAEEDVYIRLRANATVQYKTTAYPLQAIGSTHKKVVVCWSRCPCCTHRTCNSCFGKGRNWTFVLHEISFMRYPTSVQWASWYSYHLHTISIDQTELKSVQQLTYLSCVISQDKCLLKANSVFDRLYKRVSNYVNTKKVYKTVVLTTTTTKPWRRVLGDVYPPELPPH